jgi:hypothetical protein
MAPSIGEREIVCAWRGSASVGGLCRRELFRRPRPRPDGRLLTAWYRNRDDLVVFSAEGETICHPEAVSKQTGEPN